MKGEVSKTLHRWTNLLICVVIIVLLMSITVQVLPWYKYNNVPFPIQGDPVFQPGNKVPILINRTAWLNMTGVVVRELVRIHSTDGIEYEVARSLSPQDIHKGTATIVTYLPIPKLADCPQLLGNTYQYRGVMTFKPFGLFEKSIHWETQDFQIEVNE